MSCDLQTFREGMIQVTATPIELSGMLQALAPSLHAIGSDAVAVVLAASAALQEMDCRLTQALLALEKMNRKQPTGER